MQPATPLPASDLAADLADLTVPELHAYIQRLRTYITSLEAYTTSLDAERNELQRRELVASTPRA